MLWFLWELLAALCMTLVVHMDAGTWQTPLQLLEYRLPWAEAQLLEEELSRRSKRGADTEKR